MAVPNISRVKFGDFVADFDSFELRKHGTRLKLQDQPFQILKILVQRSGQLVTREELCAELWPGSTFVDFDGGLNAAVRRLRDALCDSADDARYIQTVPRHGYRFIAPVEILAFPPALAAVLPQSSAEPVELDGEARLQGHELRISPRSRPVWTRPLVVASVLLLAVALGAIMLRPKVRASSGADLSYSLAVLPLQNLSGDPAEDYFADGMTDALITNLAQSNSLKVISSTSSMRYKNSHRVLPDIGRELSVGLILEGSVARFGNHMRVSAQLVDATTDRHLWARQYDRDVHDVLQLQSEIASAVALEVTGTLNSLAEIPASTRRVNPQAYQAYLKGKYFLDKWSQDGFAKARGYFEESINLDPNFADAYAGLAEYYATMAFMGLAQPRDDWLRAEELLAKTLAMDARSVKAHTLLGMIKLQFRCDPSEAKKELEYALQLNPSDMGALDFHSYYLLEIGQKDQAIMEKQRVLDHDPLSVRTNAEMGLYLIDAGRTEEAISALQKALELDANYAAAHMRLGWAYTTKKEYGRAIAEIQKAIVLDNKPSRIAELGQVYALAGNRQEALQTITQLRGMSSQRYVPPSLIASVYARLGNTGAALDWLSKTKPDDEPQLTDPAFDSLRSNPQFKTLGLRLNPQPPCPF